jgi:peroxygenase
MNALAALLLAGQTGYAASSLMDDKTRTQIEEQLIMQEEQAPFDSINSQPRYPFAPCVARNKIPWQEMNPLQKHVSFFDWNGDGVITLAEDYRGLRAIGLSRALAAPTAVAINVALGTPTTLYPSLDIRIESIGNGVHGSDTGIYDDDGHVVTENFNRLFARWDADGDNALSGRELTERWVDQSDLFDFAGIAASAGEFGLLYLVAAEDGKISRERMAQFYDGSLFYRIAMARGTHDCRMIGI